MSFAQLLRPVNHDIACLVETARRGGVDHVLSDLSIAADTRVKTITEERLMQKGQSSSPPAYRRHPLKNPRKTELYSVLFKLEGLTQASMANRQEPPQSPQPLDFTSTVDLLEDAKKNGLRKSLFRLPLENLYQFKQFTIQLSAVAKQVYNLRESVRDGRMEARQEPQQPFDLTRIIHIIKESRENGLNTTLSRMPSLELQSMIRLSALVSNAFRVQLVRFVIDGEHIPLAARRASSAVPNMNPLLALPGEFIEWDQLRSVEIQSGGCWEIMDVRASSTGGDFPGYPYGAHAVIATAKKEQKTMTLQKIILGPFSQNISTNALSEFQWIEDPNCYFLGSLLALISGTQVFVCDPLEQFERGRESSPQSIFSLWVQIGDEKNARPLPDFKRVGVAFLEDGMDFLLGSEHCGQEILSIKNADPMSSRDFAGVLDKTRKDLKKGFVCVPPRDWNLHRFT